MPDEQDAVTAFGDGFDGRIDGLALVVAGGLVVARLVIVLEDEFNLVWGETFPGAILSPELAGWRKGVEREGSFLLRAESGAVTKDKAVAIGGEEKGISRVAAQSRACWGRARAGCWAGRGPPTLRIVVLGL